LTGIVGDFTVDGVVFVAGLLAVVVVGADTDFGAIVEGEVLLGSGVGLGEVLEVEGTTGNGWAVSPA